MSHEDIKKLSETYLSMYREYQYIDKFEITWKFPRGKIKSSRDIDYYDNIVHNIANAFYGEITDLKIDRRGNAVAVMTDERDALMFAEDLVESGLTAGKPVVMTGNEIISENQEKTNNMSHEDRSS